ncbi:hypothetical protein Goari_002859, partial [Gossypium aridum]|nr:hypothetical protein [Gossypium aridum]
MDAPTSSHHRSKKKSHSLVGESSSQDSCLGRYIYIHDLPKRFNQDLLINCQIFTRPTDKTSMCVYVQNYGFGLQIQNSDTSNIWNNNWFSTNQFMLEVIFHNRMKKYKCLTNDSIVASAIFVTYYADHFLVFGGIARDFRRKFDRKSEWGSNFRFLPDCKNMSMLTIESGPWENDIVVPHSTSFHPSRADQ